MRNTFYMSEGDFDKVIPGQQLSDLWQLDITFQEIGFAPRKTYKQRPPGAVQWKFRLYFGGFGPRDRSQRRGNGRGMPGTTSWDLATILDPFGEIFADLGPDGLSET